MLDLWESVSAVDNENILLGLIWLLEDAELTLDHVVLEEVVWSGLDSLEEEFFVGLEVDESNANIWCGLTGESDDISVLSLQCRAGNDASIGSKSQSLDSLVSEGLEPAPSVVIGKWDAVGHLRNVGFGVVLEDSSQCLLIKRIREKEYSRRHPQCMGVGVHEQ